MSFDMPNEQLPDKAEYEAWEVSEHDPNNCECLGWGNDRMYLLGLHHHNCKHATTINPILIRSLVTALIDGMEEWASDEDGIHEAAWPAYKTACQAIGRKVNEARP